MQAGIVDQDVDGAEFLAHRLEHRLDLLLVGDIRLDRDGFDAAPTFNLLNRFLRSVRIRDVIHHHIGARVPERNCHLLTDPRAGAGNEGLLPREKNLLLQGWQNHGRIGL